MFVVPFPNDSGAAIGTACCEMFLRGRAALTWNIYAGSSISPASVPPDWQAVPCDENELAELLHTEGEPVVVLADHAELGPRALEPEYPGPCDRSTHEGHSRSLHVVRTQDAFGWADRVPAIVHLDGSARLQTIDADQDVAVAHILAAYSEISGIPLFV